MSDGTSTLYYLNPKSLERKKQINVSDFDGPVDKLNELEYVKGKIYANIIPTNLIAIIDPQSGKVTGWIKVNGALSYYVKFV